ncbi:MAG: NHL repeat-containing protein [Pyrinomonadaceae bacterium]
MLAFIYLILVFLLGDSICKRFFPYVSTAHRVATGFLAGLLISTWLTYLSAALFGGTSSPMLAGNLIFAVTAIAGIYFLNRFPSKKKPETSIDRETTRFKQADWIVTGIFLLVAIVMMYSTFTMKDGNMEIANHQSSDFGSTASIMQSFAIGHNFPTEYPHFTGERIRYHFLFYFQAGNMEYLGLSPASANNVLAILTLLSMLILVMTLGAVLFASRLVGRIGAILFFFHGSLAFIPFYLANGSIAAMWEKMGTMRDFLSSGLPYRGEDWGVWSQVVYLNQRHLASSIGIFLIAVIFLAIRHRERAGQQEEDAKWLAAARAEHLKGKEATATLEAESEQIPEPEPIGEATNASESSLDNAAAPLETNDDPVTEPEGSEDRDDILEIDTPPDEVEAATGDESGSNDLAESAQETAEHQIDDPEPTLPPKPAINWVEHLAPFVLAGSLLGLMPLWNGAVFAGAAGVLAVMFVLLPLRREMIAVAAASAIIALPQVIFLKTGLSQPAGYSLWYFGYTLSEPTIGKLLYYLAFTFGFKWILIGIALAFGSRLQRLMMASFTALIITATCFQFSEEVLANHKFFNVWLVLMNVPVGFGLVTLWNLIPGPGAIAARVLAIVLTFLIVIGGVIDIFPVKNSFWVEYKFQGDPLVEWVRANTDPRAIFLSHRYVNHGILVAGRRLFYGHPYYAWGAGYNTGQRDGVYRKMLESKDINEVFTLLKANNINYVAIDNLVRNGDFIKGNNEKLYQAYFPVVFTDTENKYDSIKIYSVPETLGAPDPSFQMDPTPTPSPLTVSNAFTGGEGAGNGQFSRPRGIVADPKGNFLYVADTGNARIQKFAPDGSFVAVFGKPGTAEGELKEPNGIAVDSAGNIYVTDAFNHKLVKLDPTGQVLKEWKGPDPGFYGPRDIAFGPDKKLYIVDQGRTRIVKFDPVGEAFTSWGSSGEGEGQFHESTGIAIGDGQVFVADLQNNRIEVFDLEGKFIRMWDVPPWERYVWHYPDIAYDDRSKRLYVSNGWKNEILIYDLNGNPPDGTIKPVAEQQFNNASAMCILETGKRRRLLVLNTGGAKVSAIELEAKP